MTIMRSASTRRSVDRVGSQRREKPMFGLSARGRFRLLAAIALVSAGCAGAGSAETVAGVPSLRAPTRPLVPSTAGKTPTFGPLAVDRAGKIYVVDTANDRIDIGTPEEAGWSWRPLSSSSGLKPTSVAIASDHLWFSGKAGIYRVDLSGADIRLAKQARGVLQIASADRGGLYYATAKAIYAMNSAGHVSRAAGGGALSSSDQRAGQLVTRWSIEPGSIAPVSLQEFYFVNQSNLDLVNHGRAYVLAPQLRFGNSACLAVAADREVYATGDGGLYRVQGRHYERIAEPFAHLPQPATTFGAADALAVSPSGGIYIAFRINTVPSGAGIVELSASGRRIRLTIARQKAS